MQTLAELYTPKRLAYFLLIVFALTLPLYITDRFYLHILIMCCIWAMATSSMNLLAGYTGQVNLGHGAFFGIGAYSAGLLMLKLGVNFWPALVITCIITAFCGFLIGLPSLRTRGSYFAIGTLCFNVIISTIIDRWEALTGGARGLLGIPGPAPILLPFGAKITFESVASNYYLALIMLFITMVIIYRVVHSLVGRSFIAIRGNEELTESIGISAMRGKLLSFTVSTFLVGLAGGLYAAYIGFLSPEISDFHMTFQFIVYLVLGGMGTMAGPLIGAVVLTVMTEFLHALAAYRLVAYGFLLVIFIIFLPKGIVGGVRTVWQRIRAKAGV